MSDPVTLLAEVRRCTLCAADLPLGPRPVLQYDTAARILVAGQAPGRKVHGSGIPFDDRSGDRLRSWLGVSQATFYNPRQIALLPMGFCFPGSTASGDRPPRRECAETWRERLLLGLKNLELTLVIGQYAQDYHLKKHHFASVTDAVQAWQTLWPGVVPLPHPSPRNNRWLKQNPWFERELVPALRARVSEILARSG